MRSETQLRRAVGTQLPVIRHYQVKQWQDQFRETQQTEINNSQFIKSSTALQPQCQLQPGKVGLAAPVLHPPGAPMWLQPMTGQWAFLVAAGGRGIEVAHTALSLYRIVPVGYRVQIHEEAYRTTWGQRLMALPAGGPAGTGSLISAALTLFQLAG